MKAPHLLFLFMLAACSQHNDQGPMNQTGNLPETKPLLDWHVSICSNDSIEKIHSYFDDPKPVGAISVSFTDYSNIKNQEYKYSYLLYANNISTVMDRAQRVRLFSECFPTSLDTLTFKDTLFIYLQSCGPVIPDNALKKSNFILRRRLADKGIKGLKW